MCSADYFKLLVKMDFLTVPLQGPGGTCPYCGQWVEAYCVDHIVPQLRGGVTAEFNTALVCRSCNSRKNGRSPVQWLLMIGSEMIPAVRESFTARVLYHQMVAPLAVDPSAALRVKDIVGKVLVARHGRLTTAKFHLVEGDGRSVCGRMTPENSKDRPWKIEWQDKNVLESEFMCKRCLKGKERNNG